MRAFTIIEVVISIVVLGVLVLTSSSLFRNILGIFDQYHANIFVMGEWKNAKEVLDIRLSTDARCNQYDEGIVCISGLDSGEYIVLAGDTDTPLHISDIDFPQHLQAVDKNLSDDIYFFSLGQDITYRIDEDTTPFLLSTNIDTLLTGAVLPAGDWDDDRMYHKILAHETFEGNDFISNLDGVVYQYIGSGRVIT
ncbi:MAG: hypothetical protein U9Q15_04750, partial [Patescibacteria group bacterium]|nr:hypothetical protein [Patescibacteria group bacterium]